jgi:hypothetical protein
MGEYGNYRAVALISLGVVYRVALALEVSRVQILFAFHRDSSTQYILFFSSFFLPVISFQR